MKQKIIAFSILIFTTFLLLWGCEIGFRYLLFKKSFKRFEHLREASFYTTPIQDPFSNIHTSDYWKLYYLFDGFYKAPKNPHPLLGWKGNFNPISYQHNDSAKIKDKRPVLLFGDSFAECVEADCFEDFLNKDSAFSKEHYFLNYGVGGYGIDQIFLLYKKTIELYENPIVIFSMMPRDMERSLLDFRTGQKPYFTLEKDELNLKNTPISTSTKRYVKENPPKINSYLWRLFLNSDANFTGTSNLEKNCSVIENMKNLNKKIIMEAIHDLKKRQVDHLFVIFNPLHKGEKDWRPIFIRQILEDNRVNYFTTLDLIEKDGGQANANYEKYEQKDNGHPTSYQNYLTAQQIKKMILDTAFIPILMQENKKYHAFNLNRANPQNIEYHMERIKNDSLWMETIRVKSINEGKSIGSILKTDAQWVLDQELQSQADQCY